MYSINGHLLPLERVDSSLILSIRWNVVKGLRVEKSISNERKPSKKVRPDSVSLV